MPFGSRDVSTSATMPATHSRRRQSYTGWERIRQEFTRVRYWLMTHSPDSWQLPSPSSTRMNSDIIIVKGVHSFYTAHHVHLGNLTPGASIKSVCRHGSVLSGESSGVIRTVICMLSTQWRIYIFHVRTNVIRYTQQSSGCNYWRSLQVQTNHFVIDSLPPPT